MQQTVPDRVALETAFAEFNQQSGLLEESYRSLQDRVAELTERLDAARSARHRELLEKERLGNRLARLLETLPGAFLVIDGDGIILERNSQATDLLKQPLLGCCWAEVVQREFRPCDRVDGDLQLKDGRWVNLFRRPLEVEHGEILLLTEVTEVRRMSKLLERQERLSALGRTTASLAHQIRTPLASALLYLADFETTESHENRRDAGARKALRCLRSLDRLVNDTLTFASGSQREEELVVVRDLLQSVAQTLLPQLEDDRRLSVEFDDPEMCITGNREALRGALLNLVSNALEAGPAPQVELSAARVGDEIWLLVADNGPGIADANRERLFEPFFTTRRQGTGLGLPIVRTVARAHGGDAIFESGTFGSTFAICLPAGTRRGPLPGGHRVIRERSCAEAKDV